MTSLATRYKLTAIAALMHLVSSYMINWNGNLTFRLLTCINSSISTILKIVKCFRSSYKLLYMHWYSKKVKVSVFTKSHYMLRWFFALPSPSVLFNPLSWTVSKRMSLMSSADKERSWRSQSFWKDVLYSLWMQNHGKNSAQHLISLSNLSVSISTHDYGILLIIKKIW